jgi:hypothetical protein
MISKIVLAAVLVLTASLSYLAFPSRGCVVTTQCTIICYNASGQQIGAPESCYDTALGPHSCSCNSTYSNTGLTACHSHCTTSTGQDTFCTF